MWELHICQHITGFAAGPTYLTTSMPLTGVPKSPFIHWHLFNKYILSVYYVPGTRDTGTIKTDNNRINMSTPFSGPSLLKGTSAPSLHLDLPHPGWALPPSWSRLSAFHCWGWASARGGQSLSRVMREGLGTWMKAQDWILKQLLGQSQ